MDGAPTAEGRAEKVKRLAEEKQARLAEALRVNLHRRKAQGRARAEQQNPPASDLAADTKPDGE
jgi:hypothetical protein